jgi:hypothetical protein
MQARETSLLTLLAGQLQFLIPIFQRDYSWTEAECKRLISDIVDVANGPEGAIHFMGSVVWVSSNVGDAVISQRLVIDGQQRLTTCLLLLLALRDHIRELGASVSFADSPDALQNQYLVNPYVDRPELRSKLLLRRTDDEWLQHLLLDMPQPQNDTSRVSANLVFMREQLKTIDPVLVLKGIRRLMIVSVSLSPGQDNPQLIFESLNSTGLQLTQADLVRNYVLMGHAEQLQSDWYRRYWHPLEMSFGDHYRRLFDSFLRDFLTLELQESKPLKLERVYSEFKRWYPPYLNREENHAEAITRLQRMKRFGDYYCRFIIGPDSTPVIEERIGRLRQLVDVAATVVMVLYDRLIHDKTLTTEDFCKAIDTLESYVFRRSALGAETRSGGTIFAALAMKIGRESPLSDMNARLAMMGRGKEFPSNESFVSALTTGDMYHRRTSFYLLSRLTNTGREKVSLAGLTIEHVLPQKADLAPEWQAMLGPDWKDVQATWLHRLGNLTLTAFNSEFQANPFLQKRDRNPGGYANSPVWLNRSLGELKSWNADAIKLRGEMLAQKALDVWPALEVDTAAVQKAELDDALQASNGRTRNDVVCLEPFRPLLIQLADFALSLGDDVKELLQAKSIVFRQPFWFIELIPRANGIDIRFACDPDDLASISQYVQPTSSWSWISGSAIQGTEGAYFTVSNNTRRDAAFEMIRKAYELASD